MSQKARDARKTLFPGLRVRYGQAYQEHYRGELELDGRYIHWFYPVELSPASFTAHQKDGLIIMDAGSRPGQSKQLLAWAKRFLAENHNLALDQDPVWRGACVEPVLYRELTSYAFKPAKGNALLVGDAAGFVMPVSGEGIGVAIKSALLAARSIEETLSSGKPADRVYLEKINGIISEFKEIYPWFRRIIEEAGCGGLALPKVLRDAYQSTLSMS